MSDTCDKHLQSGDGECVCYKPEGHLWMHECGVCGWTWEPSSEYTPDTDELIEGYADSAVIFSQRVAKREEAARAIAKVRADAIKAWAAGVRAELDATALAEIPMKEEYLHGLYSALRQAEEHAAGLLNDIERNSHERC